MAIMFNSLVPNGERYLSLIFLFN